MLPPEQPVDNFGVVINESSSIELLYQHMTGTHMTQPSGSPALITNSYQRNRYQRRLELCLQLAMLRQRD